MYISVNKRKYRKDNQKWTVQRNCPHRVHKKKGKKHNTICVGQDYAQTHANSVNKTRAFLQPMKVKTNRTSVFAEIVANIDIPTWNSERKDT